MPQGCPTIYRSNRATRPSHGAVGSFGRATATRPTGTMRIHAMLPPIVVQHSSYTQNHSSPWYLFWSCVPGIPPCHAPDILVSERYRLDTYGIAYLRSSMFSYNMILISIIVFELPYSSYCCIDYRLHQVREKKGLRLKLRHTTTSYHAAAGASRPPNRVPLGHHDACTSGTVLRTE